MIDMRLYEPRFQVACPVGNNRHHGLFAGVCRVHKVKERRVFNPEYGGDDPYVSTIFRLVSGPMLNGKYVKRWHCELRQIMNVIPAGIVRDIIQKCADGSVEHDPDELRVCHAAGMIIYYPSDRSAEATRFPHVASANFIRYDKQQTTDHPVKVQRVQQQKAFREHHLEKLA